MITLEKYIQKLEEIKDQHPSFKDLPVLYSHDDEGNYYQLVNNDPGLFIVDDINSIHPEPLINGEDIEAEAKDFNCVIIN